MANVQTRIKLLGLDILSHITFSNSAVAKLQLLCYTQNLEHFSTKLRKMVKGTTRLYILFYVTVGHK